MSIEFHNTVMGKRFIEGTLPRLVDAINRLAKALEEYNGRCQGEREGVRTPIEEKEEGEVPG